MRPSFGALEIRDFRNLWLGQTVSQLGDAVYGLTFIFMADRITRDSVFVGYVASANALPFLLLSPLAGVAADRMDRRRIMLFADLASTVLLLAFAGFLMVSAEVPRWTLVLVPFLLSCVNVFFFPARGAAVPRLVPPERLLEATSLSAATQSLMQTLGLALSVLLLAQIERLDPIRFFQIAILVNAATFLLSWVFIRMLPAIKADARERGESQVLAQAREGFDVIFRHPVLGKLFAVNLVTNLFIAGFMVVYTATNREWFGGSFATLAGIEFAFMLSMVVGSMVVNRLKVRRVGLSFVAGSVVLGATVAGMAVPNYVFYVLMNVAAGLALPFVFIPLSTYMNLVVEDHYRGRVNSVASMVSAGVQPVGAALTGFSLKAVGLVRMYLVMGGGITAAALAVWGDRHVRAATMPAATEPLPPKEEA
ncbi:MAG: MFS transporter [Fimbriimonadaceae bacterium]|nr:MFS transporter [Fimbriimonadaceae bacterium]QYK56040.1 MAG: MFS transporter [Fimbriimonadaceae bacterium]